MIVLEPPSTRPRRAGGPLLLGATLVTALATHHLHVAHVVAGLGFAAVLARHVQGHRRWLAGVLRRVGVPRRAGGDGRRRRTVVDLVLALAVLALAALVVGSGFAALGGAPGSGEVHGASCAGLVLAAGWHGVRHGRRARRRERARRLRGAGGGRRPSPVIAPE